MKFNAETLIDAALEHGENSEPDHEAGDLQQYIRSSWELLTRTQRRDFYTTPAILSVIETSTGKSFKPKPHHFNDDGIEHILRFAQNHGRDEGADPEIGDLQDCLRVSWQMMDVEQKSDFFELDEVEETYENAVGHPLDQDFESNPFPRPIG